MHTTGRLAQITVQSSCLFKVICQEICLELWKCSLPRAAVKVSTVYSVNSTVFLYLLLLSLLISQLLLMLLLLLLLLPLQPLLLLLAQGTLKGARHRGRQRKRRKDYLTEWAYLTRQNCS